ncbi:tyrosine-protein kinase sid-3-like isoform X2 [Athalia rosae]|nr:tyrosine-protein kinase sid-3-like isoform X2 [Athalia rosae]
MTTLTHAQNQRRSRRVEDDLQQSYIVHYNNQGQPLSVAGFEDFVRALNRQRASSAGSSASSYSGDSEFPPSAAPTTTLKLTTTAENPTPHQPKPLASETSTTQSPAVISTASPEPAYVNVGPTESPSKLPPETSDALPVAKVSSSTDKPTSTLALGHDTPSAMSIFPGGPSIVDASNLVTPGENPPSKMTVSSLGFPSGASFASKVISLQPAGIHTLLNYATPLVANQGYASPQPTTYVQPVPMYLQKTYLQPETSNYAPYPNQNLVISDGTIPLRMVRHEPQQLIDIGQGVGQGYESHTSQGVPLTLGGWGGVDYSGHRSIPEVKPVLGIAKLGYAIPASSSALSKIGFGVGSW